MNNLLAKRARPTSVTFLAVLNFATAALYLGLLYLLWRTAVESYLGSF